MILREWLKPLDSASLKCNIFLQYEVQTDEGSKEIKYDLIYAGSLYDVPYWLAEYEIAPKDENGEAISFCHNMFESIDDEQTTKGCNGLCIYLQEKE